MDEPQPPPIPTRAVRPDPTITPDERIRRGVRMIAASARTAAHIAALREADWLENTQKD
jgi:hypothetical protein